MQADDGDFPTEDAERWRAGLKETGKLGARAILRDRPGGPDDPVFDVVSAPPYPPRRFVERWIETEETRLVNPWLAIVILVFVILIVVALAFAFY
ncbi:MAG TPA: hypothetical protein VME92_00680 [Acetobacteraceae bacterium]|nr:hypothetical protein [Acetobacteraceae bacterium]